MSDSNADQPIDGLFERIPLEFDGVVRFLQSWHLQRICRNCNATNFTLGLRDSRSLGPVIPWSHESAGLVALEDVVAVECGNCGLIDLFRAKAIQRWLAENPIG